LRGALEDRALGHYRVDGLRFDRRGWWNVRLNIAVPGGTDSLAFKPDALTMRTELFETIVIGGGQAGLATGYYLAARDIDFVILDGASRVGDS